MMNNGDLVRGKPPTRIRQEFIEGIIDFVFNHLALWRDEPDRPKVESEKELNEQLSNALNDYSREKEKLFTFTHESGQGQNRSVDIAAREFPSVIGRLYTSDRYENLTVFEAKRLPAHCTHRKREYITGESKTKFPGGVQRFKAGLHGKTHTTAAIIGYIQQYDAAHFFKEVNSWIDELCVHPVDALSWSTSEKLSDINILDNGTARTVSSHPRQGKKDIVLHHLWITMEQ